MSIDQTLRINPFVLDRKIIPREAQYIEYSSGLQGRNLRFDIRAPNENSLLESEVWLKQTIRITQVGPTDLFDFSYNLSEDVPAAASIYALRQGFVLHRALERIECIINNVSITESPREWSDHVMRYYLSHQENETVLTLSGGKIDQDTNHWQIHSKNGMTGQFTVLGSAGPFPTPNQDFKIAARQGATDTGFSIVGPHTFIEMGSAVPNSRYFSNKGLDHRYAEMYRASREDGNVADGTGGFAENFDIEVWERLPISPFHLWDRRDVRTGIPHIKRLTINLDYSNNLIGDLIGGFDGDFANSFQANYAVSFVGSALLRCRWITPPLGMKLPASISIPMMQYRTYRQLGGSLARNVTGGDYDFTTNTVTRNFPNLRFRQMPSKLFIYVTPDKSKRIITDPSEYCCSIETVEITYNGNSGKILRIEGRELYSLYVRNMPGDMRPSFREWDRHFCCVVLTPADIGLGPQFDNSTRQVIMDIKVRFKAFYVEPQVEGDGNRAKFHDIWPSDAEDTLRQGVAQDAFIHVTAEYNSYKLNLHRDSPSTYTLE